MKEETMPGGRRYSGSLLGQPLVVSVLDTVCRETMTGLPHPQAVEVR